MAPAARSDGSFPLLLGFDIGSQSCKGVLVNTRGEVVVEAARAHSISRPRPGWEEQSPRIWWDSFIEICRSLDEKGRRGAGGLASVDAVGITGFVPGLCAVAGDGRTLGNAIMHTDIRAREELAGLNRSLGLDLSLGTLLPKLLWLKTHRPEIYREIDTIMVPHSYLAYRLTGIASVDYDTASIFGGIFELERKSWDTEACRRAGVAADILPPPLPASKTLAGISREASQQTGLIEGTPLIVGSGDSFTALIGAGAAERGDLMVYMGTSGTRLLVQNPLEELADGPHFGSGKVDFVGRIFSCGETLERFRRLLGDRPWAELDDAAEEVEPGAEGLMVVPNLKQRRQGEGELTGRDSIVGYGDAQDYGHLMRAAMEGIALLAREGAETVLQGDVKRVIISGGPVKSRPVTRIMAAVFGGKVYAEKSGHSGLGAALLAGYGRGIVSTLDRNRLNTCKQTGIVEATPQEVDSYADLLRRFKALRRALHEGFYG